MPTNSWWTGTDLSIEEARRLVPHKNATTVQVAISVVAAVIWMIQNPRPRNYAFPTICRTTPSWTSPGPTWVNFISTPSDWTPLKALQ